MTDTVTIYGFSFHQILTKVICLISTDANWKLSKFHREQIFAGCKYLWAGNRFSGQPFFFKYSSVSSPIWMPVPDLGRYLLVVLKKIQMSPLQALPWLFCGWSRKRTHFASKCYFRRNKKFTLAFKVQKQYDFNTMHLLQLDSWGSFSEQGAIQN